MTVGSDTIGIYVHIRLLGACVGLYYISHSMDIWVSYHTHCIVGHVTNHDMIIFPC